jgi:hypothetical protein
MALTIFQLKYKFDISVVDRDHKDWVQIKMNWQSILKLWLFWMAFSQIS